MFKSWPESNLCPDYFWTLSIYLLFYLVHAFDEKIKFPHKGLWVLDFLLKQILIDGDAIARFSILFSTKSKNIKANSAIFNCVQLRSIFCANIRSLVEFLSEFNTKGDILMEHLRLKADGKQIVTLLKEFNHAALDSIACV